MVEADAKLLDRDYTIILVRLSERECPAPPGLRKQWQVAEKSILNLAAKCEKFDPDGLTIYIADRPFRKYSHEDSCTLAMLFQDDYSTARTDLVEALKDCLQDYFDRKAQGTAKANGEMIVVILDHEPIGKDCRKALVSTLVQTTHKVDRDDEIGVMFAQVGDNMIARGFLQALDDDLHLAGAKYDITDTKLLAELPQDKVTDFLLLALTD
ncbi:hypothetical protein Pse7367_2317 [Thalassoporum mexicanum PCC 7367]|uniref:hypothetical protein n=1 Tax=Thalassoporum mexicanum TaxID=3457544 RepID=UPI00029FAAF3|nr:hypothetical protein [Pseudanabaena sp. PCC 7367]AFY70579.1 hypothetical protein Pse7367_2317 [Pseudanabaena sp. PCC 7367]